MVYLYFYCCHSDYLKHTRHKHLMKNTKHYQIITVIEPIKYLYNTNILFKQQTQTSSHSMSTGPTHEASNK